MISKLDYPKDWDEVLSLEKKLKKEVSESFDVNYVVIHDMHGWYHTVCFVMSRYTPHHKFVPYIQERYGLEFLRKEYCHSTMLEDYTFILRNPNLIN